MSGTRTAPTYFLKYAYFDVSSKTVNMVVKGICSNDLELGISIPNPQYITCMCYLLPLHYKHSSLL